MSNELTPKQIEEWVNALEAAMKVAHMNLKCSIWATQCLSNIAIHATGRANVVDLFSKDNLIPGVLSYPDPQLRNFSQLGTELDDLIKKINTLLPEVKK